MARSYDRHFGHDYASSRSLFLEACSDKNIFVTPVLNEGASGPAGEPLYCDVAYWGRPDAPRLIILSAGTHGAEAGCGAGLMTAFLDDWGAKPLPDDVAVLFINHLNPWGAAHMARTTEDNVDLNRNFVDFAAGAPSNAPYRALRHHFDLDEWTPEARQQIADGMDVFHKEEGEAAYLMAMRAGQYDYADDIGFGGHRPTWSRRLFEHLVTTYGQNRQHVAFIDIHTGVGSFAEPVFICFHPVESDAYARAQRWWKFPAQNKGNDTIEGRVTYNGTIFEAFPTLLPSTDTTVACLEFGTLEMELVQHAIVADVWRRHHPDAPLGQQEEARALIKNAFYPNDPAWRARVEEAGLKILHQTVDGILSTA